MRLNMWRKILGGFLLVILSTTVAARSALPADKAALAEGNPSNDDVAQLIHEIEAPQVPNRQGLDGMTLQEVMQKFHIQGLSIAVIKDFKIQWAKGYGVADVKTGWPVETNTLFQAASISKPVTAMAALRLAQEGRF